MNRKKIITLSVVLIVLVALLAVVLNLPDKESPDITNSDTQTSDNDVQEIYNASMDSITKFTLSVSGETYTVLKSDSEWICPDKSNVQISQSAVLSFLTSLHSLSYTDKIAEGEVKAEDCGINDASDYVSFDSDLGSITLTLGYDVSDSQLCYLATSLGKDVYMIDRSKADSIFVPFSKFRNDSIERVDFENLQSIELVNSVCSMNLVKSETDHDSGIYYSWTMTSPVKVLARDNEIKAKITDPLSVIDLSDAVSDNGDLENYGLSGKDKYVKLTDANGRIQTVYFSDRINNSMYICVDSDTAIYEISPAGATFASLSVIDICDRQLYLTKQVNLDSVVISGSADYTVDFSKDDSVAVNGRKKETETEIRDVFTALCTMLADDIHTSPIGETVLTITYNKKDGTSDVLEFADADERYYYAAKNGVPIYKILKSKIATVFEILDK